MEVVLRVFFLHYINKIKNINLSDCAETPGGNLLCIQLNGVLREAEPLLDNGSQFTDPKRKFPFLHFWWGRKTNGLGRYIHCFYNRLIIDFSWIKSLYGQSK